MVLYNKINFTENFMKRTLRNIIFASIITLIVYIGLYAIWGAILKGVENATIRLLIIALMSTAAFGFSLLYISKIRKNIGEDEVISDYKNLKYISFVDDFQLIKKRESQTLICITSIVGVCFVLNTFDNLVFQRKIISLPTFIFTSMCLFDSVFDIPFVGYLLSAIFDCLAYMFFLLIYRKKRYDYWMKEKV